ncbi:hypothetical protein F511_39139 [Dorcoceras hygrometricum]|uniref:Uncharacterized protein n=1 Tax=Dorcoceras hygrometricum TaxID=472368 RepID=A0A2Z7AMP6_9LAMI|nr:hypothetical protein F511_39139 [Dorcoceras hygrometricum]
MIDKRELCDPWMPSTDLGPVPGEMQHETNHRSQNSRRNAASESPHGGAPPHAARAWVQPPARAVAGQRGQLPSASARTLRATILRTIAHADAARGVQLQCARRLAPNNFTRKLALQRLAVVVLLIRSTTGITTPSSVCTRKHDESFTDGISSSRWSEQVQPRQAVAHGGGGARRAAREGRRPRGRKRRGGRRL